MSNSVSGTMRAADFTLSLGINTHIDFGTSYANLTTVKASINYLDAKNLRGSMENPVNTTTWLAVTKRPAPSATNTSPKPRSAT